MDLTRLQVETLLNVSPQDLDLYITEKNLPCYTLGEEKRFDLLEIESWMMYHKFWEECSKSLPYNLYRALARGGFYSIDDLQDASILKLGASHLAPKLGVDPEVLYAMLQDRENLASTAMGNGYAIPHPRERLEGSRQDILFIIYLKKSIDFAALDQQKVHTFFFLVTGSDRSHLNVLSKLAHLIHYKQASAWISDTSSHESLLKHVLEWETNLTHST
jgi:PTS system nitrogen regulatory IIA component